MTDHASLHNHSHYSVLDGYGTVHEYVKQAVDLGLRGIGMTDHGNVSGIYEFIHAAKDAGITPVPGCEMYVAPINPLGSKVKSPIYYGKNGEKDRNGNDVAGNGAYLHLTVFAVTTQGLRNLMKLSSASYEVERTYMKPRIDLELLSEYSEGLVVSTGCPSSEISTRFRLGQDKEAYDYAGRLKEIFGDRLYVEIMDHGMEHDLERKLLPKQLKLAKDLGLELLATNDSHYAHQNDARAHEELLCAQSGSKMTDRPLDEGGTRFAFSGDQYFLKSGAQMAELFPAVDFPRAVSNSVLIAEMAQDVRLDYDPTLRPLFKIPDGYTEVTFIKKLIQEGYKNRYGSAVPAVKKEAQARIKKEFDMYYASNFLNYFLVMWDCVREAKNRETIFHPETGAPLVYPVGFGRGSAGGCIIAYLLGITEIDPIRFDLLSERFMTPGRGETFRITYDDGTYEDVLVSEVRKLVDENGGTSNRYIHQLAIGDTVEV